MYPVPSQTKVTFPYGVKYTSKSGVHKGVDFKCPTGRIAIASVSGVVVHAGVHKFRKGWGKSYGLHIIIDCDRFEDGSAGLWAGYMHLSRIDVKVGQRVKAGQEIGRTGNTGDSTGSHLHFEVQRSRFWSKTGHVNPQKWLDA